MANLRLVEIKASDSTHIEARFTDLLDPILNTSNVEIVSNLPGIPDPAILAVSINQDTLEITCQPLTPYASYFVTFKSSNLTRFKSLNGQSFLLEDGKTNTVLILGSEDPANPIRDLLLSYLQGNIYSLEHGTIVRDLINSQSNDIARALYDIRQAKNDNYLSVTILDEQHTRGAGPYDRLNEEGAYQIIRVGKTRTGATLSGSLSFDSFPDFPITLQTTTATETLLPGAGSGTFNGLILTVSNNPVTKLTQVIFKYNGGSQKTYNIGSLGYQLQDPTFDQNFASTYLLLDDNQIKLSDQILTDPTFIMPQGGDTISVSYEYKDLGKYIDPDSVIVSQVLDATREVTPPILTIFTLQHAPIVNDTDVISTFDGVVFLDPLADPPFSTAHPAFLNEIPFRLDSLPSRAGDFTIDYPNGAVYVFGSDENDGTGDFPPTATYKYRKLFSSRLDYTYDPDSLELAASSIRDLATQSAKISFNYEETLVPFQDFSPQIHQEILDERIENRINSSISLSVKNAPITNVFRILNETSGELYKFQRYNNEKVYFNSKIPPRILSATRERASFTNVSNEILIVNKTLINSFPIQVYQILLANNRVMSSTEDVIGSSFNSSVQFSRTDIFTTELYYDSQIETPTQNINRLEIGDYLIDYQNGIVYLGVSNSQDFDIGTISYKKSVISPDNSHVTGVSEVYNSISTLAGVNKRIQYVNFGEGFITPLTFDLSDERFLNGDTTKPYIIDSNTITVTDSIKTIRNIYDYADLINNKTNNVNFAIGANFTSNIITLTAVEKTETLIIQSGNLIDLTFVSNGVSVDSITSIIRTSDGAALDGTLSGYTITLNGTNSPSPGQQVYVIYELKLNGAATPIVDYNRGDYFIDYNYLADEILISYEYGDNNLDFREFNGLDQGNTYYVSYKVGARRDALLKNFGTLVDIPILNSFDTSLPREHYRDSLMAALQSFTKGPTIPSMKGLVSTITKVDPQILEAAFELWSLGISYLYPNHIQTTGDPQLMSGKFDNGILIDQPGQTISIPVSSNLRLEDGTLEMWVIPEWDGLDNDASLTFSNLTKNSQALSTDQIWIGANSYHPTTIPFTLNRKDTLTPIGLPSTVYTQTGLFIYYDDLVKRWKLLAKDLLADGYVYSGNIQSSGEVYDVKFIPGLGEINDVLRSDNDKIGFTFNLDGYDVLSPDGYQDGYNTIDGYFPSDGYQPGYSFDGITFMADDLHYFFDFATTPSTDRFSLFKDGKGYLNFEVWDKGGKPKRKNSYKVSTDISSWNAGEKHHVGLAWRLNSSDRRDEMHLFIDGFEVPNIIKYGGRPVAASTDRFRTVKPEILAGIVPFLTIGGDDLTTTFGSNIVSSSINFSSAGVVPGYTLTIRESGFSNYNITGVSGNSLILSSPMPASITNGKFSVNEFSVVVSSEVDLYNNITVGIVHNGIETEIAGLRADNPQYGISKNLLNQNLLTIFGSAMAGDDVVIRTLGLNHRRALERQYIWGNTSNILKTQLPPPINLDEVSITTVILPFFVVGPSNSILSAGIFTTVPITDLTQTSNNTEGRTLSIRVNGNNVDFSTPVSVTINGDVSEVVAFTQPETKSTVNKFKTLNNVVITAKPIIDTQRSVGVEIKEAFSLLYSEGNNIYPILRFSYKTQTGTHLQGTGSTLSDTFGYFTASNVGQKIVIYSPGSVAGTYNITSKIDNTTITVSPTPAINFTGGSYDIFNTTLGRSGFQNGFFTLEQAGEVNTPYPIPQGYYEFDYQVYLEVPFDPLANQQAFIGSDFQGNHQAKAIIDELVILSKQLTDVRVGESISSKTESITTDFTRLKAQKPNSDTLVLMHFDELPLVNSADFWVSATKEFIQSDTSVNDSFGKSLVITDTPLIIDNKGFLPTTSEGTIEFWVSPRFDTYNDPNIRFYFDATGSHLEEVTSITNGTVKLSNRVSQVISVKLAVADQTTGVDYFAGGRILSDFQTLQLGQALPYQQTPVKVSYIPSGLMGDRISIYKDAGGYINFEVKGQGIDYQTRQPVFWSRDTWHRVRATFKFNQRNHLGEIRLFVDGEERGVIRFGTGLIFGTGIVFGQDFAGVSGTFLIQDIIFRDPVNQFYIGSDYLSSQPAEARFDNFKISNITQPPFTAMGQPLDVNFTQNLDTVLPVIPDAFTTYLLNYDTLVSKNTDFALLRNEAFGIYNFTINVIDSFDIVSTNSRLKEILETLITTLKPAQSKATINYV